MKLKITLLLMLLGGTNVYADALHDAICNGQLDQVKKLVTTSNVNKPMDGGDYALSLAAYCYGGQPAIATYLLDRGANVNLRRKDDYPALMWAIRSMKSEPNNPMRKVAMRMVRMGADAKGMNPSTKQSALMWAASAGDTELVDLLLKGGADKSLRTNWCTSDGTMCNAADFARIGGYVELALKLDGKDPAAYRKTLHYAAKQGDLANVKRLISAGANVSAPEQLSKLTPLHYAVKTGKNEIVSALLAAKANPNLTDFAGITPLRDAVISYKPELAKMLIDAGAKADHAQTQGCGGGLTEFGWAISYSQPDIARYMIERGAIDLQNPGTAFQELYGRADFHLELIKLLVSKGAKPTQEDLDKIKKVYSANAWMREQPYAGRASQIMAYIETVLNKPVTPAPTEVQPETDVATDDSDTPSPPSMDDLGTVRERGGLPAAFRTRSLSKQSPRVQKFDSKFRNTEGKLQSDAFWAR